MSEEKQENVMIDVSSISPKHKVTISKAGVDVEKLAAAESIITNMADSYLEWAQEDIARLQKTYIALVQDLGNYKQRLKEIFEIAHDMKGQGGSFKYYLMTEIANYLCRFVERIQAQPTQKLLDIIRLHIDAMRMVVGEKIKGDGGEKGRRIMDGLEKTIVHYLPDTVETTTAHRRSLDSGDEEA